MRDYEQQIERAEKKRRKDDSYQFESLKQVSTSRNDRVSQNGDRVCWLLERDRIRLQRIGRREAPGPKRRSVSLGEESPPSLADGFLLLAAIQFRGTDKLERFLRYRDPFSNCA